MLRLLGLLALLMSVRAATGALAPGDHDLTLRHGGRDRTWIVHVPPGAAAGAPLPVVLVFHGGGGNARGQQAWSRLDAIADREGFLAVYPDGTGRFGRRLLTWNAGSCCGYAHDNDVDDVGFVLALLDDLAIRTAVDRRRVYATGMSNGAMMSYRLAAEASDRIAAIAPVAGAMVTAPPPSARPVPVMHFHSVDDPRAPYAGGLGPLFPFLRRVEHPPVERTIAWWVEQDGCARTPHVEAPRRDDTGDTATRIVYAPCRDGAEVILWRLNGAGHVWPGAPPTYARWLLGPPTRVVDASAEMWAFFRRFALSP